MFKAEYIPEMFSIDNDVKHRNYIKFWSIQIELWVMNQCIQTIICYVEILNCMYEVF